MAGLTRWHIPGHQYAVDDKCFAGLQVFGDPEHPPDAEFGCCALVYGPDGSDFEGEALLRVDVGAARGGRARPLPLHFVLPADQAIRQVARSLGCVSPR